MGLVNYSDSGSDSEDISQAPTTEPPSKTPKKPTTQKLFSRTESGKILINLRTTVSSTPTDAPEPPAKRLRVGGTSSRFSGLASLLPPPKAVGAKPERVVSGPSGKPAPRSGIHLKTGVEPAFSRGLVGDEDGDRDGHGEKPSALGLMLPPPKKAASGPSIPDGQKPEEEVELVGKPLMFKPLSVTRRPGQKPKRRPATDGSAQETVSATAMKTDGSKPEPRSKKKVSLFSIEEETTTAAAANSTASLTSNEPYEPLFEGPVPEYSTHRGATTTSDEYAASAATTGTSQPSLASVANGLGLSEAARRDLFGRPHKGGASIPEGAKFVNFNMDREYAHNEDVRASGEQIHNPVRPIAPGKHSLRQMVDMVQTNKQALEDSFAQNRNNRNLAAGRYGWK